jgi:hypothetical protein
MDVSRTSKPLPSPVPALPFGRTHRAIADRMPSQQVSGSGSV